jgi:hypothetical protein
MLPFLFPDSFPKAPAVPRSMLLARLFGWLSRLTDRLRPSPFDHLDDLFLSDTRWAMMCAMQRGRLGGAHATRAAEIAPLLGRVEREMRRRGLL